MDIHGFLVSVIIAYFLLLNVVSFKPYNGQGYLTDQGPQICSWMPKETISFKEISDFYHVHYLVERAKICIILLDSIPRDLPIDPQHLMNQVKINTHRFRRKWSVSRCPYYNNHSATFNILLNCGDVETNPGPSFNNSTTINSDNNALRYSEYNYCSTCHGLVHYSFGLLCDSCNAWMHYSCIDLSFHRFIEIISFDELWTCPLCLFHQSHLDNSFDVNTYTNLSVPIANNEVETPDIDH